MDRRHKMDCYFRRALLVAVCWGLVSFSATGGAYAQAPDGLDEARAAFELGRSAYERGDFAEALTQFRTAYQLSSDPAILYNIGTVADRLRQDEVASEAYERYLQQVPDASDRENVEARIRELRAAIGRAGRLHGAATDAAGSDSTKPMSATELWGWSALGGSVGFGAACLGFLLDDAPSSETWGIVSLSLAIAAIGAAITLFVVSGDDDAAETTGHVSFGPTAVTVSF